MTKRLLFLAFIAASLGADTYPRLSVDLRDGTDEIAGNTTVDVLFVKDGVTGFDLDLAGSMHVLDANTRTGETRSFRIRCRGKPADVLRIGADKFGDRTFFSSNFPTKGTSACPS